MRWFLATLLLAALNLVTRADEPAPQIFTFAKDDAGKVPTGWKADHTGTGEGSIWKVVADATAPSKKGYVLAQTAATGKEHYYNLCVANDARFTDLEASVAFKAIAGKEDQGGGIVWRYQNADNYYICRMNPLEDNFRVYKVIAGKRVQLATTEDNIKAAANEWHTIQVTMNRNHIECFFNGNKLLEVNDDAIKEPGKVGVWSKADAQSRFDMLSVRGK